jgi:hypothetical protein
VRMGFSVVQVELVEKRRRPSPSHVADLASFRHRVRRLRAKNLPGEATEAP